MIEPFLTLKEQAQLWSAGFAMLAVLVAVAGLLVARRPGFEAGNRRLPPRRHRPTARLIWAALSAIPVGLVIAVTSYITTDIASAPFLWVLPLALYLLTFVAVFRDRRGCARRWSPPGADPDAVLAISLLSGERQFWLVVVVVNLVAFVLLALCAMASSIAAGRRRLAHRVLSVDVARRGCRGRVRRARRPAAIHAGLRVPDPDRRRGLVLPGMFAGGRRRIVPRSARIGRRVLAVAARSGLDIRLPEQRHTRSRSSSSGLPP